jgi:hypothetical protein
MLRRVAHVKLDLSKVHIAPIIKVTRIGELGTTLTATSNRSTLRRNHPDNGGYTLLRNVD